MKKYLLPIASLLVVIIIFAFIDYLVHDLKISWGVPEYYYRNKIIYGFIWIVIGWFLTQKLSSVWLKSFILAGLVSAVLQIRYFLEGYDPAFVLLFLLIHFLILFPLLLVMFLTLRHKLLIKQFSNS